MSVTVKPAVAMPPLTDLDRLRGKPAATLEQEKARLRRVTKEFESFFTYQMLKTMRKTIPESPFSKGAPLSGGAGKGMFTDLFDMEVARRVSGDEHGSIADLLYRSMEKLVEAQYRSEHGEATATDAQPKATSVASKNQSFVPVHRSNKAIPFKRTQPAVPLRRHRSFPVKPPKPSPIPLARRLQKYQPLIEKAARENNLDAALLRAVIHTESGGDPAAVSPRGAKGLMQLMDSTAVSMGVKDPFDPAQNIRGGAAYLRRLLDQFGDLRLALAAYNAGPAAVERYGGIPPYAETHRYVDRV
ncbi:MAG: hypothetical protein D6800_11495, partial [Candidatus Zixiibacteriota bacterium]